MLFNAEGQSCTFCTKQRSLKMHLSSDKQSLSYEPKWSKLLESISKTKNHLRTIDYHFGNWCTTQGAAEQNIYFSHSCSLPSRLAQNHPQHQFKLIYHELCYVPACAFSFLPSLLLGRNL